MGKKKEVGKQRKVTVVDLFENFDALVAAARAGRLVVLGEDNDYPTTEQVKNNVRAYVKTINSLAMKPWQEVIDQLWDTVLSHEEFVSLLMPSPNSKKCRKFNKYGVMRIVGVLREHSVYDQCCNDLSLCQTLEQQEGDCSYRSYLGKGFEKRSQLHLLEKIVAHFSNSSLSKTSPIHGQMRCSTRNTA